MIPPSDADGLDRARSATEAFLYRRLETLAETAGRFRLDAELAIPFDGWGRMEVDLLCGPSHIAIELDGRQHLGDAESYRRDRRKDALLQENGYRVLRFLAEDVGKCLDQVLDAILRALAHQNTRLWADELTVFWLYPLGGPPPAAVPASNPAPPGCEGIRVNLFGNAGGSQSD